MTDAEALAIPLSEIELAELSEACRKMLTLKGMLLFRRLAFERDALRAEVARLRRGEFTPAEFQSLCHHRDERPGCTRADFEAGCVEYQRKLFGDAP